MTLEKITQRIDSALSLKNEVSIALARLGIHIVADLLLYRPLNYSIRVISPNLSSLKHGDQILTRVKVEEVVLPKKSQGPIRIFCVNSTGSITLIFFRKNRFILNLLKPGNYVNCSGKVEIYEYLPQISHPEIILDKALHTSFEPTYPLTYGIINNQIRLYISKLIHITALLPEWMPLQLINDFHLQSFHYAITELHKGGSSEALSDAINRLKFDEAFANQMGFKIMRSKNIKNKARVYSLDKDLQKRILERFGHTLTESQKTTIKEIELDQSSPYQMIRMIQGDVGCGKTIVSLLTSVNVLQSGGQVALIAPTEVLAHQHFNFISTMLSYENYKIAILTSKTPTKTKNQIFADIESGNVQYIIGTHALFNPDLHFKDLSFVIIDEQHKFGVQQRMTIASKGNNPDILLMSATPIPRTLSMAYFGDLSMSCITDIPSNRKKTQTVVSSLSKLQDIIRAIELKISRNEQIYWICPLIEAKDTQEPSQEIIDVQTRYEYLYDIFGSKVSYLYGSMTQDKKNEVIEQFRSGLAPILISTTVVEVGVDVPDATLIVIENAERFGLAQLHQLRGRVGRGYIESCCILLRGTRISQVASNRLNIMKQSHDGFFIAEKDLALRGEGEFFGEKQSGEQNFRFLDISSDAYIIESVRKIVQKIEIEESHKIAMRIFNKLMPDKDIML